MSHQLKISTPQEEGILRVSKWLKFQVLLDEEEMSSLFDALAPFFIFQVSQPIELKQALIVKQDFLDVYKRYVQSLKNIVVPEETLLRHYFSSIFTRSQEVMYGMKVSGEKFLIKPTKPVLQLQLHHFYFSPLDEKFHSMVLSEESVTWGIQFSYPSLYQDPFSQEISKVGNDSQFPNTELFSTLVKWLRQNTVATPFLWKGKRMNASIRLGKKCFSWISQHPSLQSGNLKVMEIHAC